MECQCQECKNACRYRAGWFIPGEAERAASYLNIPLEELFKRHLSVDWWDADEPIFLLAPALRNSVTGEEYPGDPRGECVFFADQLCAIHPVKPFECAQQSHDDSVSTARARHAAVANAWKDHQDQIISLLGRPPVAESFGVLDLGLFGLLG